MNSRASLALVVPLFVLACEKDGRRRPSTDDTTPTYDTGPVTDPDPDCDTGLLDDDGECVPAACGTGTWGNLELDESTVFVDLAAADGGDGSEAAPFVSIQDGLDAAADADGGMVAVAAGTYQETLELGRGHDGVHLAGRCSELVVIDASVGGEYTSGIAVSARTSEVEVSGLTVSGAPWAGVFVGSGTLTLRDSTVARNEYMGIGAHQEGVYETSLAVESCEVTGNAMAGVAADESGTTVMLQGTIIEGSEPDENGQYGYGITAFGGASLSATSCELSDNTGIGVFAYDEGTTVALEGTTIRDTRSQGDGQGGYGVHVYGAASLMAEGCELLENRGAGVLSSGTDTAVSLQRTTIQGTQPSESGELGFGVLIHDGAHLNCEDCSILESTKTGVHATGSGSTVILRETTIKDTRTDEEAVYGFGIDVQGGASLEAQACEVSGNRAAAVYVSEDGTTASLRETSIQDTLPDDNGLAGYGILVTGGASVEAEACQIARVTTAGVVASDAGSSVSLRETTIHGTQADGNGDFGLGINLVSGASVEAEACELSENVGVGIRAYQDGTSLILRETVVRDTLPDDNGEYGFGIQISSGASLEAEACELWGNRGTGFTASGADTTVSLCETTIRDTQPTLDGQGGFGVQVSGGASLLAEACVLSGNTSAGLCAGESGTTVTLADTSIVSTAAGEVYTIGNGITVQDYARVEGTGLELSSNEGPAAYIVSEEAHFSCSGCRLQDNQFAAVVVICDASLMLDGSVVEGTGAQENLGGGIGIYVEPYRKEHPPFLEISDTTIRDNPIAGVWVSGQGSDSLSPNAIHGGEGWSRGSLSKCGDAVFASNGVTAWDGGLGLLLESNELRDARGAGLFLDDASASLSGNTYADNALDLVSQGDRCDAPPDGYESEDIASAELCPSYDYATCVDEFSLFLQLALPKSGIGAAQAPRRPSPRTAPHLSALPLLSPLPPSPPPELYRRTGRPAPAIRLLPAIGLEG